MQTIKLYEKEIYDGCLEVALDCYTHKVSDEITATPRPAMLVFPGGGYAYVSDREAEPIASVYFAEGYNCFVLRYITGEKAIKNKPLTDAAAAVAHISKNSDRYNIDTEKIAVIGFSAGGHLAGYIATSWHVPYLSKILGEKPEMLKPNAAILGYPVISGVDKSMHMRSFENLLGKDRTDEETRNASIETLVSDKTCPFFIWHTAEDDTVPVKNSLLLANSLTEHKIKYELHIFPCGGHGLSRANRETAPDWAKEAYTRPYIARWVEWSVKWLDNLFYNGTF